MNDIPSTADARNSLPAKSTSTQLIGLIKAHIAKGDKAARKAEDHYIAAGQYLKQLKAAHDGRWEEWEALLKSKIGIGKSRASELMQIADGRKTVGEIRASKADSVKRLRASPLRSGENVDDLEASEDGDDDYGSDETIWRRGLLNRAKESAGHALYEDWSTFTVDDEVIAAAKAAAAAWAKAADYLQQLRAAKRVDDGLDVPSFLRREPKVVLS